MNYDEWINRERKIRISLLLNSPLIQKTDTYRTCENCGEICLCHEDFCPNCNANNVIQKKISKTDLISGEYIRCSFRYANLYRY
jgi:hypothetical protein